MRTRLRTPGTAAICLVAVTLLAGCGSGGPAPAPSTPTAPVTIAPSTPTTPGTSSTPTVTTSPTATSPVPSPAGLVPVWPFTTLAQVAAWQQAYRSGGQQPWHLDVERTALSFTRGHLRYTEIDRVTTRSVNGGDARIGVGWNDENGAPHTVAELHLVRFGPGQDAPWVVVGTEDTYLTLTAPRYGATVTTPLAVGGRITGVDESLRVVVLGESNTPLAEVTGLPAGGERTPWTTTVRFSAPRGTVLTIAVSTGGHLKSVERFALTAVRAG